jgi:hypothetical protein
MRCFSLKSGDIFWLAGKKDIKLLHSAFVVLVKRYSSKYEQVFISSSNQRMQTLAR